MTPTEAKEQLIKILDLDPDMDWDDIVYYTAKSRGSLQMVLNSIEFRTEKLNAELGLPAGTGWWQIIDKIREWKEKLCLNA